MGHVVILWKRRHLAAWGKRESPRGTSSMPTHSNNFPSLRENAYGLSPVVGIDQRCAIGPPWYCRGRIDSMTVMCSSLLVWRVAAADRHRCETVILLHNLNVTSRSISIFGQPHLAASFHPNARHQHQCVGTTCLRIFRARSGRISHL